MDWIILVGIIAMLALQVSGNFQMSRTQEAIDALETEVEGLTDATEALSTVVDNLVEQVEESIDDPEELQAIIDNVRANKDKLVAAALKGTPAEPAPEDDGTITGE